MGIFADIGGYSLTASAELLDSPLSPSLTLLDANGQVLANTPASAADATLSLTTVSTSLVYMLSVLRTSLETEARDMFTI